MEDNIFDKVKEVDLRKTMEESYIDYAMSVIASRRCAGCQGWFKTGAKKSIVLHDRAEQWSG